MSDGRTDMYKESKRLKLLTQESKQIPPLTVAQLIAYLSSFNPNDEIMISTGLDDILIKEELTSNIVIEAQTIVISKNRSGNDVYYSNYSVVPVHDTKDVLIIRGK